LRELGAQIISSDELGHQAYLPGTATYHKIIQEFGNNVVGNDGKIDRAALGASVFGNPARVKRLSDIVWPAVGDLAFHQMKQMEKTIKENPAVPPVIVLEAALLIEAGWQKFFDKLWVFKVDPEVAKQRIVTRNNLTLEEAAKRVASQLPNEERAKYADAVFDTNREPDEVKAEVVAEYNKLLTASKL